jgi:predicted transcriptional regulator
MNSENEISPLKKIRKELNLTQLELARETGLSQGYISEMEAGLVSLDKKLKDFLKNINNNLIDIEEKQNKFMEERQIKIRKKLNIK